MFAREQQQRFIARRGGLLRLFYGSVVSQPPPLELACLCFGEFIIKAYVPRILVRGDTVFDEFLQAGDRLRRFERFQPVITCSLAMICGQSPAARKLPWSQGVECMAFCRALTEPNQVTSNPS